MPSTPPLICNLDQAFEGGFVQLAVFERRDNRGVSSGEHNFNPAASIGENVVFGESEFLTADERRLTRMFNCKNAKA